MINKQSSSQDESAQIKHMKINDKDTEFDSQNDDANGSDEDLDNMD